jgi:hypothetical protein
LENRASGQGNNNSGEYANQASMMLNTTDSSRNCDKTSKRLAPTARCTLAVTPMIKLLDNYAEP